MVYEYIGITTVMVAHATNTALSTVVVNLQVVTIKRYMLFECAILVSGSVSQRNDMILTYSLCKLDSIPFSFDLNCVCVFFLLVIC